MSLSALLIAAAVSGPTSDYTWPGYRAADYRTRSVSAAQCLYSDGEMATLLRTRTAGRYVLVRRMTDGAYVTTPVRILSPTKWEYFMNGGMTTYHSFELAVSELLERPQEPLNAASFYAVLERREAPACKHSTFDVDFYEDPSPIRLFSKH